MRMMYKSSFGRRVSAFWLALLLCLGGLTGCGKKAPDGPKDEITATPTEVVPTATPTPTPEPWTAYEKIGQRELYRVPVKELSGRGEIFNPSVAGNYLAMQVWVNDGEVKGPEWAQLVLLQPAKSGESVSVLPDYPVNAVYAFADGTVLTVETLSGKVRVYDASLTEQKSFTPFDFTEAVVLGCTKDGMLWIGDNEKGRIGICDRNGENTRIIELGAGRRVYTDLGSSNGTRYLRGFNNDEESTDTIFGINEKTGEVSILDEHTINVMTGEVNQIYSVEAGLLRHISNETWFLRRLGTDGHWIAFPKGYSYEGIDLCAGDRLAVQGFVRGLTDDDGNPEPRGCRIIDLRQKKVLGRISSFEIGGASYFSVIGLPERDLAYIAAGSTEEGFELLLWDLSQEENETLAGFCDLTEDSPEKCLAQMWEDFKEYGVEYNPSEMKMLAAEDRIAVLQQIDFANVIMSGLKANPDEFQKGEDGVALHIENIRGHERGYSKFNPHVMTVLNAKEYGEDKVQAFYNLVDAMRAGETWYDAADRMAYNWSVGLFATWFYPVASGCIKTSYDYRDKDVYVDGRGRVPYTVSIEEAQKLIGEFDQMVCDILDDCIADDYTDFEKALALYEFMTQYCTYDYYTYAHINDPEVTGKGHIYRCFTERTGICWALSGMYDYLLMQCGVNVEEVEGFSPELDESHAWSCIVLDGQGYYVDVTWGLASDTMPKLAYFCFSDDVRDSRDGFPLNQQKIVGYEDLSLRTCPVQATDTRFAPLWDGRYVGMDRTAKKVIYLDNTGVLRSFPYGE